MLRACVALLLGLWFALAGASTQSQQGIPVLTQRVTDLTATLSPEQRSQLDARLAAFEREKGAQIAVLIVPSTQPEAIEQYSIRVAEQWKLGRKGVDDGVLLLVAKQDKKLRIEVGYGLEGALNDATAKRIIAESITPRFKEGKFYEGIDAGLTRIIAVVGGEPLPEPTTPTTREAFGADSASGLPDFGLGLIEYLIIGLVVLAGVGTMLRSAFGRLPGSAIAGIIGGSIAMFFVTATVIAIVVGVLVFLFSLFSGGGRSGRGGWLGGGGGFSSGSSGSSWSSSSSDSFSGGGGGDFGGGGASGDW